MYQEPPDATQSAGSQFTVYLVRRVDIESMAHAMETRLSKFQDTDSALRSLPYGEIVRGDTYSEASACALDAVPPIDSDIDGFLFTHDDVIWSPELFFRR